MDNPACFLKPDFLNNGIEAFFGPGRAEMAGHLEFCPVLTQHLNIHDFDFVHDTIRLQWIVIRYIIKLLVGCAALLSERVKIETKKRIGRLFSGFSIRQRVELHSALAVPIGAISV